MLQPCQPGIASRLRDEDASSEVVSFALTVGRRSSWRGCLAPLWPDAFWPHKDAQRCRLLLINECGFGRSAVEWAGSGYGLEGWGFESLRARHAESLIAVLSGRGRVADAQRHPYNNPYSYRDASQL
jgi:hypothetical protein